MPMEGPGWKAFLTPGEAVDRDTILQVKLRKLPEGMQRERLWEERALLALPELIKKHLPESRKVELQAATADLIVLHLRLWEIEDSLRECESRQQFDDYFVELARHVYRLNDRRTELKRAVDLLFDWTRHEVKKYSPYGRLSAGS